MPYEHHGHDYAGSVPENYERYFVPRIGGPLAEDLVEIAALRPGERVLDVACGTGVVARLASQQVGDAGSVTGLDLNPGMLAAAAAATPAGASIEWREGNAEALPFPDASFDVVLCQMGLQFVPDKAAALREAHRVLVPGGRLVLSTPGPTPRLMATLAEALGSHVAAEAASFVTHVFSLDDAEALQSLLAGAGFEDVSVRADTRTLRLPKAEQFLWQYVHSTPLAGAVAQLDDERLARFERDVVDRWQELVEDGELQVRLRLLTATGRK